ncbi:MAG: TrbI/VirB10 family protein [Pseudoxanthomonas sp.]
MNVPYSTTATDPRLSLGEAQQRALSLRAMPAVAHPRRAGENLGLVAGVLGALALGAITLISLSGQRTRADEAPGPAPAVNIVDPPAAPVVVATTHLPEENAADAATPVVAEANTKPDPGQSRAMPMIIDNTGNAAPAADATAADASKGSTQTNNLSADELFAFRSANDAPPSAQATALGDGRSTVVQGAILPAVLETAINSDLPGYARAVISRDVRSFDGSQVLIPRGSRLVGQYKSGLSAGQSRAYLMWTRLIRPDGVSIQLGSPAMDAGGEIGLPGEVNRHFWQRFGASILLSVVSGAAGALGDSSSVVIASSGTSSAAGVALETNGKIPPTIRVPQGTPIQVFVARDLDFSTSGTALAQAGPLAADVVPTPPQENPQ